MYVVNESTFVDSTFLGRRGGFVCVLFGANSDIG